MNALFLFTFLQTLNLTVNYSFHVTLTAHKSVNHDSHCKTKTQLKALKTPTINWWSRSGHIILIICDLNTAKKTYSRNTIQHHDDSRPNWPYIHGLATHAQI